MPLVSVVIPLYNCERYVRQALESILGQTFRDFEIIVVNGSTDASAEIVEDIANERISLIRRAHEGLAPTMNACTGHARGRLVAFMSRALSQS